MKNIVLNGRHRRDKETDVVLVKLSRFFKYSGDYITQIAANKLLSAVSGIPNNISKQKSEHDKNHQLFNETQTLTERL